ncbi:MAG: signal peptidase II [Anaerovoracaceae bacterium]|jgi:signal peptidase II
MVYFLLVIAVVVLDQVVKHLVVSFMSLHQSIPVIDGFFHVTYTQNTGAAFSLLQGQKLLLIGLPVFLICVGLVYIYKHRNDKRKVLMISVALIVGGGIGNLIDRISLGYVVDLFDFRVFPIFNVADIFVTVGCALLCIYILFIDGKKHGSRR